MKPDQVQMEPWAAELLQKRRESRGILDPAAYCKPVGEPGQPEVPLPYKIVQTPGLVLVLYEENSVHRQIFLDARKTVADPQPRWNGYSTGRWEGDTLVVETANFHPNGNPMGGYSTLSDQNLRLVERFKRVAADTLEYTFTVDNPTMWTRPWTAVINWKQSKGELLEYACHEGNYSLRGMLSAARADEAASR